MKYATIGTGWITDSFIEGAKDSGRFKLEAVYSRDIKKAAEFAIKHEAPNYYDHLEAMAESDIQVVYIASPHIMHFEHAAFFLRRGKHVICEKPMTTKPGQIEKLFALAEENGVYLLEAFRHINSPGFQAIKEALDQIAPVRNAILNYNQYSSKYDEFRDGKNPNAFNKDMDGGAIADIGIYPISFAAALWGRPESVVSKTVYLSNGADGAGSIILKYPDFLCSINYSKITEGRAESEILGEKGSLVFQKPVSLEKIMLYKRNENAADISVPMYPNTMRHEAEVFADLIEKQDKKFYDYLKEISWIANDIMLEK